MNDLASYSPSRFGHPSKNCVTLIKPLEWQGNTIMALGAEPAVTNRNWVVDGKVRRQIKSGLRSC